MQKLVEINKCPNCDAKLERSADGTKLVCNYCGAEFELVRDEEAQKQPEEAKTAETKGKTEVEAESEKKSDGPAKETESAAKSSEAEKPAKKSVSGWGEQVWIDPQADFKKLVTGTDTRKMMKAFVKCTTELKSSEAIIRYIRKDIEKGKGVGMVGSNEGKLNEFVGRIKNGLDSDEKPIVYANTALLSNGKKGILVTDKRTIIVTGKTVSIEHEDLDLITFENDDDLPCVYYNGNDVNELSAPMDADGDLLGAMVALACAFAFEQNPGRNKIVVKQYDEDADDED